MVLLQSSWRARCAHLAHRDALRQAHAATTIQAMWRGHHQRAAYQELLPRHRAAGVIGRVWRSKRSGEVLRGRLRGVFMEAWQQHKAAVVLQTMWRAKVRVKWYCAAALCIEGEFCT